MQRDASTAEGKQAAQAGSDPTRTGKSPVLDPEQRPVPRETRAAKEAAESQALKNE